MSGISFSGLGSGIDFDSLRSALMSVENQKLTRISKKQDLYKNQRTAVSDVNNRLTNLIAKLDPILAVGSADLFGQISATSSNTSVLTATATSSAAPGSYDIRVKNLAAAESAISKTGATVGNFTSQVTGANVNPLVPPMTAATLLSDLNGGAGIADQTSGFKIHDGSSSATVDISTATTVGDVLAAINGAGLGVTAAINGAGNGIDLTSAVSNKSLGIEENGGTTASNLGIFGSSNVIQVKTAADASYFNVYLDGSTDGDALSLSLADIRDSINAVTGKTFTASVVDSRLVLGSNSVGTANALNVVDNAANGGILEQLGVLITDAVDTSTISSAFAGNNAQGGYLQAGTDALFSVNGVQISRSKNTGITDVISDVTLNLASASTSTGAVFPTDYSSTTLTVAPNTATISSQITDFFNQYNSVVDFINTSTAVNPTGEDGVLVGDSVVRNLGESLFNQMTALNPDTGQSFRSIFEMKDSAGTYAFTMSSTKSGQIDVNTTALNNLLAEDPTGVAQVLRSDSDSNGTYDGGIVFNMKNMVHNYNKSGGILPGAISIYDEQITQLDEDYSKMQERLTAQDASLKRQFSTAEQLIASMQSQSSSLSSILGKLN